MSDTPLTSPDDQGATFVELFFDLVFVFAISRVTHHFAHYLSWAEVGPTVVVCWLLWWAWTQFTWTLNSANTNRHDVRLVTLVATGLAFLMAASIGQAFGNGPFWFAVPYVLVRVIGLLLYDRIAGDDPEIRGGVRRFAAGSILGFALVLVGAALEPPARYVVWGAAAVCDVGAAWFAGRHEEWHLRMEHFAERHGLIVIIALGEALIVAGVAVAEQSRDASCVTSGILATITTCLLWWTYFGWAKDGIEHGAAVKGSAEQVRVARDAYSFLHFPLVLGIIAFAAGLVVVTEHAQEGAPASACYTMAAGILLFTGSTAAALYRATGVLTVPRLVLAGATAAAIVLLAKQPTYVVLGASTVGLLAIIVLEHVRPPACKLAEARERSHTA